MSDNDLKDELERLRNENAALKNWASSNVRMKVSEKGAVSVYGLGRFPVTLYKEQWRKLLDMSDQIRAFMGGSIIAGSPRDFGNYIVSEVEKWGRVIKFANIRP
jgi:hypothetical protein